MIFPSNTSTNSFASPTNAENSAPMLIIPTSGQSDDWKKNFALITSLLLCNKTNSNLAVSAKVTNGQTSAYILYGLNLPPNVSYDVIDGNKLTLKEGDTLYVWHNSTAANALDAVLSYTLHRPLTTYDI